MSTNSAPEDRAPAPEERREEPAEPAVGLRSLGVRFVEPHDLWWIAGLLLLLELVATQAPEPDEPVPLRWLRTAEDHRFRTLAALILLRAAVRRGRPRA